MANSRALTMRFATDVEPAKRAMASLSASVVSNMALIAGASLTAGRATVTTASAINAMAETVNVLRGVGPVAFIGIAAALAMIGSAVKQAREEMAAMLEIAKQSAKVGVSPEFFQAFRAGLQAASKDVLDLKTAGKETADMLGKAFETLKEKWGESSEAFKALMKAIEYLPESRPLLERFFAAPDIETKTRIVLEAMRALKAQGYELAALDLGDKMFGSKFTDQVRTGQKSFEALADTIEKTMTGRGEHILSNDDVKRAEDLDQRLQRAWETIDKNLKPAWEGLASVALDIKNVWVSIIELLEKASRVAQVFSSAAEIRQLEAQRDELQRRLANNESSGLGYMFGLGMSDEERQRRLRELAQIEQRLQRLRPTYGTEFMYSPGYPAEPPSFPGGVPLPKSDPRKKEEDAKESLDQIERFISAMEKARDVTAAELSTLGLSNAEREKAIALERAKAAARLAQRELTDEEKAKVLQLAEAHAKLKDQLLDMQQRLREAAEAARYFGNAAANALADIIIDGKNANEVMANLLRTLARAALQAALVGQGPLAWLLGMQPPASAGPNAVGGMVGWLGGLFGLNQPAANPYAGATFIPNPFAGGQLIPTFHGGGLTSEANSFRLVSAAAFANAPRYHGGIGPGERAAILRDGEGVFTPGQMRALGRGGHTALSVALNIDARGAQAGSAEEMVRLLKAWVKSDAFKLPVIDAMREAESRRRS